MSILNTRMTHAHGNHRPNSLQSDDAAVLAIDLAVSVPNWGVARSSQFLAVSGNAGVEQMDEFDRSEHII